jgi:XTP/dITP diphosphohydrolase
VKAGNAWTQNQPPKGGTQNPFNMKELLIATHNKGKLAEIERFLDNEPFLVKGLSDFAEIEEVAETGDTFSENAILKARGYALQTGTFSLADDSGLEIAALDGAPGVFSARYGGEDSGYEEKMRMVLAKLAQTPAAERRARFVCVMALANEQGEIIHTAEGICDGSIALQPRGNNGFGYDPIFIPDGFSDTFGELETGVKQQISHRKRAFVRIMPFLLDFTRV